MTFKSLFGQITILSLSFITFRVSHFPVSHLTYETVKLCLQNTLNMSKMTGVYFGVLQSVKQKSPSSLEGCPPTRGKTLKVGTYPLPSSAVGAGDSSGGVNESPLEVLPISV